MELIRFRGDFQSRVVKGEIHGGNKGVGVCTGVSAVDSGLGVIGTIGGVASPGVRALGVGDPEVGQAAGLGRREPV